MLKEKLKTESIINKPNANAVGADDPVCPKKSANPIIANAVGVAPLGDPQKTLKQNILQTYNHKKT